MTAALLITEFVNVSCGSRLCKNSVRVLLARFSLNSKNGRPNKNNILLIYGF